MNILLMTPPHTNPVGPTLGIAVLAAHLKKEFPDMEIKATDIGLDAVYWLLSEKNIEDVICRLEEKIDRWNGQDTLDYEEQRSYAKVAGALCILKNFKTKVWKAINQLKDKETYQCDAIRKDATLIINKVLESIGEAFPHTQLNAGDYRTELSPFSIKDIESYVNHPEKSVYNDFFEEWLKQYDLSETALIGLSISFAKQIFPSFLFASKLKQRYPNMTIIIGGSMMAHLNQEAFETLFQWCDCIIQREGEYPLENIVKCLCDKRAFYPEMGAIYLDENGQMVQAAKMPKVDLNQELPPDFSDFRLKDYIVPIPNIPLQIGRSCYWGKCTFCCLNTAFEHKDCWTKVEKMVDDIEYLVKNQGIETIEFVDDAIPPVFAEKLSQELLKRQCHVKWFCYARFDEGFKKELFHLMHEAGCVGLKFGLESASEHVSKMMNKGIDLQKVARIFEDASQAGIIPQAAFFFGFPGEKTEDIQQTVDFINKYVLKNGIIAYNGIFRLLKSMPLLQNPDQYEIDRIEKWNTDEELIDYYQIDRKYNLNLDTIKAAEEELAALIDKDLTRSVDLRRYWFMGYSGSGQDVDIAEKYKSQMLVESCFPLDQIRIMQDKNNGDFLPGKGIYNKKSYISGELHQAGIMERLCEVRPKMKAQEEAIYSYDMKWKRFTRLENQLTFVTKVESEENILIGMKT